LRSLCMCVCVRHVLSYPQKGKARNWPKSFGIMALLCAQTQENELKWCHRSLQSDSVRSLTLRSRFLARPWTVAGLAIVRFDFPNVDVKGSHICEAHHFLGLHSLQSPPGLHFRQKLLAKFDGSRVRRGNVCRARCKTLNCLLSSTATAFNSVRPC